MLKFKALAVLFAVLSFGILVAIPVSAQQDSESSLDTLQRTECNLPDTRILGIPAWYIYLQGTEDAVPEAARGAAAEVRCNPSIDTTEDALPIGLAVFEAALTIGGIVAVVMIFVGSFNFVLSQGEPDKAASARRTVINAAVGLVILLISARVVSFIAGRLTDV